MSEARKFLESLNLSKRKGEFQIEAEVAKEKLISEKSNSPEVVEFQKKWDDIYIVGSLLKSAGQISDFRELSLWKSYEALMKRSELAKAMDTATAGAGAEWIPTGFSAELIDKVQLALKVAAIHPRVPMPRSPFEIPGKKGFSTARLATEGSAVTESTVATRKITLSAKKLMVYVPFTYELEEDSIVALLPVIKADIVNALARGIENATINGDSGDADITAADDVRKAWKGYRAHTLAAAKLDMATFNVSALRKLRKLLGIYGSDVNELCWIVSLSAESQMRGFAELQTIDKYGQRATILTGEIGKIDGIPVITSEFVREDLNASGVYDGVTTDRTMILLVRRDGFIYGDRRQVLVETDKDIKKQTNDIVASQRLDFQPRYDATTETIVGIGFNIST